MTLALPFVFDMRLFLYVATSLLSLYGVIVFIPSLSITIRRLHDAHHTALAFLLLLLPIVGEIYLLFLLCQPSSFRATLINERYYQNTDDLYNQTYGEQGQGETGELIDETFDSTELRQEAVDENEEQDETITVDESQITIEEAPKKSRLERVKECQQLLADGEISREEYDKMVAEILSN